MAGVSVSHPRFGPLGYRLAAVRDRLDLVVWDLGSLPEPPVTFPHPSPIRRIAFSPDGRYLAASAANGTVRIWDVVRGEAFGPPLPGALGRFSPDGSQVLVIGIEGGAWLWDLSRIVDDTLAVPVMRAEQLSASSADGTLTAEVTAQGITLKTPTGRSSLVHPGPVASRRFQPRRPMPDRREFGRAGLCVGGSHAHAAPAAQAGALRCVAHPPTALKLPLERATSETLSDLAALLGKQRPDGREA